MALGDHSFDYRLEIKLNYENNSRQISNKLNKFSRVQIHSVIDTFKKKCQNCRQEEEKSKIIIKNMNVFIILSILIIVIGVLIMTVSSSVLFKFNWNEKTGLEKILMIIFYSVLLYIINIIYWFIK